MNDISKEAKRLQRLEESRQLGEALGKLVVFIRAHQEQAERIDALESRVAEMEEAARRNAPAVQAAWMHVPLGGR